MDIIIKKTANGPQGASKPGIEESPHSDCSTEASDCREKSCPQGEGGEMVVWHHRGYMIRSKNDGTQYYEVRYHGEKKFSGKTFLEAVQFINTELARV